MKKLLSVMLILLMMSGLTLALAEPEPITYTFGNYKYILLENGTAEITGYTGKDTSLTIPATLDGYAVTSIGNSAFSSCDSLATVSIPDSIATIGENPFYYCKKLTDIIVSPDHPTLATIDGVLFEKKEKKLIYYPMAYQSNSYIIPQGVRIIGDSAFFGCDSLTTVSIPDSVTAIGDDAFYGCDSLATVSIPDSVTAIGDEAFSSCDSLATVSIPDSVTSIGDYAFSDCSSLTAISIPDSVTTIGANPFCDCNKLTDIIVSPDHPILATIDGVLFEKTEKKLICYPMAYQSNSYVIPQGIRIIGDSAFKFCSSLTTVSIPDSVTAIGDEAFFFCDSLATVSIPDSVTAIGDEAFFFCNSLATVSIPDSVTSIGDYAFSFCSSLTAISIPDSVTTIGANPFYDCQKLTDIIVSPDHPILATIDGVLFEKTEKKLICYPMAYQSNSYVIPQGIRIIGDNAFYGCDSLTTVSIPDSVTAIGDYAFSFCDSLATVSIPDSVTFIGDDAFIFFDSPTTIIVPRNSYAAQYCKENGLRYTYPDANDWLYN